MHIRHIGGPVALLWVAIGATGAAAGTSSGLTPGGAPTATRAFNVLLTVAPEVPGETRRALLAEAETIWRHEGVTLRWLSGGSDATSDGALRVLVIPKLVGNSGRGPEQWAAGELVRFHHNGAIAIASISGAQRIIESARSRDLPVDAAAWDDVRLGVVLGRTVAHEIGHYLLHTNTHAKSGLMRATFDAREFADLRAGAFRLDEEAGRWIRQRLLQPRTSNALFVALEAQAPSSADRRPAEGGFSYLRH